MFIIPKHHWDPHKIGDDQEGRGPKSLSAPLQCVLVSLGERMETAVILLSNFSLSINATPHGTRQRLIMWQIYFLTQ